MNGFQNGNLIEFIHSSTINPRLEARLKEELSESRDSYDVVDSHYIPLGSEAEAYLRARGFKVFDTEKGFPKPLITSSSLITNNPVLILRMEDDTDPYYQFNPAVVFTRDRLPRGPSGDFNTHFSGHELYTHPIVNHAMELVNEIERIVSPPFGNSDFSVPEGRQIPIVVADPDWRPIVDYLMDRYNQEEQTPENK